MASNLSRFSSFFVAALIPAVLSATPAASTITSVTVYTDRAVVTRSATLDLLAGDQVVTFEQLPSDLQDDSLHVAGTSPAHASLGDVTANVIFPERTANGRVAALQDELKAEQKQLRTLTDRSAALDKQRLLVTRMSDAAAQGTVGKDGSPPPRMQPAEMQQLLDFYGAALVKLSEQAQALDAEREPVKDQIAATTAQLEQLGNQQYKSTKTVTVHVTMAEAGKLELTLAYAIGGARWRPSYEARVASADHKLTLGYYGIVTQATGEDWKGVTLTLSTAHPAVGGNMPELAPWYVDEEQTTVALESAASLKQYRAASTLAGTRVKAASIAATGALEKDEAQALAPFSVEVTTNATSATFHIPGMIDVPSDQAPHKETVAIIPLEANLSYQTTPKLLPSAFLSAAVTNSSDYPLLGGPMAVFLDETFVTTSRLKTVMPGEKFDLALGVDEAIAVERKLVNRFAEDEGLITKKNRVTFTFLITVTNHRKDAAKVVVRDQLPVSRLEKIEVAQIDPSADKVKPDNQGVLKWTLSLAPGEKQELPLKFSVTYPSDLPVSGLE